MKDQKKPQFSVLKEVLDEYGVPYKQNSRSFILDCPRCNKKDKLYFEKSNGWFVCWYCRELTNFKGRPEYALSEVIGQSIGEVKEKLYGKDQVKLNGSNILDIKLKDFFSDEDEPDNDATDEFPTIYWPLTAHEIDQPLAQRGAEYLNGRGISIEIAKQYGIRYDTPSRRVLFPVHGTDGRLLGYQKRLIVPHEYYDEDEGVLRSVPKVLSTKAIPRDRVFMFWERMKGSEHAVVTEGPVDALKAHLCGGNIASMGKAMSRQQIELLRNSGIKRVYLALDPDAADETSRLVNEFYSDMEVFYMPPAAGYKDLGEMPMEAVYELFQRAVRVNPCHLFVFLKPRYR